MNTVTSTKTYTVADVEKVVRSIKADFIMIANSSKAMTEEKAADYAHDIEVLAKKNYLQFVDLTLMRNEVEVRAIKYEFQTEGATAAERPGGVLWPMIPKDEGGWIRITLRYTESSSPEKRAALPLKISWVPSSANTNHEGLSSSAGRGYSSNGFGTKRKDFS